MGMGIECLKNFLGSSINKKGVYGTFGTPSLSGWRDSNPRPPRPERGALPDCATPRFAGCKFIKISCLFIYLFCKVRKTGLKNLVNKINIRGFI